MRHKENTMKMLQDYRVCLPVLLHQLRNLCRHDEARFAVQMRGTNPASLLAFRQHFLSDFRNDLSSAKSGLWQNLSPIVCSSVAEALLQRAGPTQNMK